MPSADVPVIDTPLVERLVTAETRCHRDWVSAIADLPGNPYRASVTSVGDATVTICGTIPAEVLNRVFGLRTATPGSLDEIGRLYADAGATPTIDIAPDMVAPFWEAPTLLDSLDQAGYSQAGFHQLLFCHLPAVGVLPPEDDRVTIRVMGPGDVGILDGIYSAIFGDPGVARVWLDHPAFTCYVASVDGTAAALGVLHMADGVASMTNGLTHPDWRGRGCQNALLRRRLRDAAVAGCDLAVSQCRPGSQSQRNQIRAGFAIAGTKAWWMPRRSA